MIVQDGLIGSRPADAVRMWSSLEQVRPWAGAETSTEGDEKHSYPILSIDGSRLLRFVGDVTTEPSETYGRGDHKRHVVLCDIVETRL